MSEDCYATGCDVREGSCQSSEKQQWQWRWKCCWEFLKNSVFPKNHQTRPIKLTCSTRASWENKSFSDVRADIFLSAFWTFLKIVFCHFYAFLCVFFFFEKISFPSLQKVPCTPLILFYFYFILLILRPIFPYKIAFSLSALMHTDWCDSSSGVRASFWAHTVWALHPICVPVLRQCILHDVRCVYFKSLFPASSWGHQVQKWLGLHSSASLASAMTTDQFVCISFTL